MRKYTEDHVWLDDSENEVAIGLTAHALSELGDIVYVELPEAGAEAAKGEEVVVIESTKATSGIVAPCECTIAAVNQPVADAPETITAESWFIKITPHDPGFLDEYLDEAAYQALIG